MSTIKKTKLAQFISENMYQQGLTPADVSRGAGISKSYLSNILNGNKVPSIDVVNRIADFFNTPRTILYNLMDWISLASRQDQDQLTYLLDLAKQDPQFAELVQLYSQCKTDADRRLAIRVLQALLENKE